MLYFVEYYTPKMMRKVLLYLLLSAGPAVFAQDRLLLDLDKDGLKDTVRLDRELSVITYRLSTQQFRSISSKAIDILNETSGLRETHNGFAFYNDWMRAGYNNQFRFDAKIRRIQLIGMSRYEFGNAANDGSGKSSVNLLTGDYIGNWNYFDVTKDRLIALPEIRTKMPLPKTYLDTFGEETYFNYAEKCTALYHQAKAKAEQKK